MERLMRQLAMGGGALGGGADVTVVDTAETVYISSQALLKMLKHGARSHANGVAVASWTPCEARRDLSSTASPLMCVLCLMQAARACRWK
jgi:hypothetical protein